MAYLPLLLGIVNLIVFLFCAANGSDSSCQWCESSVNGYYCRFFLEIADAMCSRKGTLWVLWNRKQIKHVKVGELMHHAARNVNAHESARTAVISMTFRFGQEILNLYRNQLTERFRLPCSALHYKKKDKIEGHKVVTGLVGMINL